MLSGKRGETAGIDVNDGEDHSGHGHRALQDDHEGHDDHGAEGAEWRFGCALLGGFLIPMAMAALFPRPEAAEPAQAKVEDDPEAPDEVSKEAAAADADAGEGEARNINYRLCSSVLIGDAFHNFGDGVFVGIGFLLCNRAVALSILFITFYHEIAQELADFFLLTKQGGLSVCWTLVLNFVSGLTVLLGGITVLAANDITAEAIGIILAIAAGVYIYIAASECVPRVEASVHSQLDRLWAFVGFLCGAVPIGLALLNHEHCEGGGH